MRTVWLIGDVRDFGRLLLGAVGVWVTAALFFWFIESSHPASVAAWLRAHWLEIGLTGACLWLLFQMLLLRERVRALEMKRQGL